mgnify:CR=1 FL=1|jgi:hypothetical protein
MAANAAVRTGAVIHARRARIALDQRDAKTGNGSLALITLWASDSMTQP